MKWYTVFCCLTMAALFFSVTACGDDNATEPGVTSSSLSLSMSATSSVSNVPSSASMSSVSNASSSANLSSASTASSTAPASSSAASSSSSAASSWSADAGGPVQTASAQVSSVTPTQAYVYLKYDQACTVHALIKLTSDPAPANALSLITQSTQAGAVGGSFMAAVNTHAGKCFYSTYTGDYTIYLVAVNGDGKYSAITTVTFSVDKTPPQATLITASEITSSSVTISIRYNEACAVIFLQPLLASVTGPATFSDFEGDLNNLTSIPAETITNITISDLTSATAFKVYAAAMDDAGNQSVSTNVAFSTL